MTVIEKRFKDSISIKGARGLSSENVEALIEYAADKPYILGRVEAKRIEQQFDRDMPNYSIYGCLPSSGDGLESDKNQMILLFRKLNKMAQEEESYAIRYDVWFSEIEVEENEKGSESVYSKIKRSAHSGPLRH